jgi:nitrogen fixation NifU-like protein
MSDLTDLYQELILDHNKKPRNFGECAGHTHDSEGLNPTCGDQVHVYLRVEGDVIVDISFTGHGCAISKSSASIMTTMVKGKTLADAMALFVKFHALVSGDPSVHVTGEHLGKLAVFAGVREYPARVKCASLPWHALKVAVEGKREIVKTED